MRRFFVLLCLVGCMCSMAFAVDVESDDPFVQFWNNIVKQPFRGTEDGTTWGDMMASLEFGAYMRARYEYTRFEFVPSIYGPSPVLTPAEDQFGKKSREWFAYRVMFNAGADLTQDVRLFGELVNMRVLGGDTLFRRTPAGAPRKDPQARTDPEINLYQGYVFWDNFLTRGAAAKVGRQELTYGDEWLLGNNDFYGGFSYDAAKLSFGGDMGYFDMFAARVPRLFKPEGPVKPLLFGFYSNYIIEQQTNIDFFGLFTRDDMNPEDLGVKADFVRERRYTIGARLWGELEPEVDYDFKGAYQFGKTAIPGRDNARVRAYALQADIGKTWSEMSWEPRIGFRAAIASGKDDPTRTSRDFNPLYQDFHGKYGYADAVKFSNIENYAITGSLKLLPTWTAGAEFNQFFYASKPNGFSSHFADEYDLFLKWEVSQFLNFSIVYANFHKGKNFRDVEGTRDRIQRFYVNAEYAF